MRGKTVSLALAIIALVAAACSPQPAHDAVVEVDCDALGAASTHQAPVTRRVTVDKGGRVVLRLCANPSTGFAWEDAVISAPQVLTERSREFIAAGVTMPGGAGLDQWIFEATGKGECTIALGYSRPWDGGETGIWLFELEVAVE